MDKTFFFINHQNKGLLYAKTLEEAGWEEVGAQNFPKIALVDSDVTPLRTERLDFLSARGTKLVIYPHSARPPFFYDFPGFKPHPGTVAVCVPAENHRRVLDRINFERPVHVTGWSFCDMQPFRPAKSIKQLVFAPLHANANGWLSADDKKMNMQAHLDIYALSKQLGAHLRVRYIKELANCGITELLSGVEYVQGSTDIEDALATIDAADLVVGTETFAYMAVARGRPTLMMDESRAPRYGNCPERFGYVTNWEKYKELVMYPYDVLHTDNLRALAETASQCEATEWRKHMLGNAFDAHAFLEAVSSV